MEDFKPREIKSKLGNGEIQNVINDLLEFTSKFLHLEIFYNAIVLKSGEFSDLVDKDKKGIIKFDDYYLMKNRIRHALLELTDEIDLYIKTFKGNHDLVSSAKINIKSAQTVNINEQINYVLVAGGTGAGKSTLIASLCNYLNKNFSLKYSWIDSNQLGLEEGTEELKLTEFKDLTSNKSRIFFESDIGLQIVKGNNIIPFTFLEGNGNHLIELSNSEKYKLPYSSIDFMNGSNFFLMLTSFDRVKANDFLIAHVYDYYSINFGHLKSFNLALVITKWGNYRGKFHEEIISFLENYLPQTFYRMRQLNIPVFTFSILDDNKEFCRDITDWILREM